MRWNRITANPTRITAKTETVIDIVLVSDNSKICRSGVFDAGISDHCIVYVIRKSRREAISQHNTVKLRSLSKYSPQDFIEELSKVNWTEVLQCDVDMAWDRFKIKIQDKINFLDVLSKVAPYKDIRIKQRTEPWMKDSILKAIREHNDSFKVFKRDRNNDNFEVFKRKRNEVRDKVKEAKKTFFKDKISEMKQDSQKLWRVLSDLGYPEKTKIKCPKISLN